MARQNNTNNIQPETYSTSSNCLKNMIEMLQQIMQQEMTLHMGLRSHKYLPVKCKRAVTTHFRSEVLSKIK